MKVCKKILSAILVLLILISGLTIIPVGAADWTTMPNTTMELTATCDYSSAFEVLDYLNAYRVKKGLEELVMDEELLECAMQRAAELTVKFSHTRPDGSSWIKMHDNLWAENAAMNQVGAYYVVEDWKSSSGHNYNMLLDNVTAVGIGAVIHNGIPCWIQLFATEGEAMVTVPENTDKKFYINLGSNTYSVQMATPDEMVVGETYEFQVHSLGEISGRYYYIIDNDCLEWTSSNPEVATVKDGVVTAVGSGKTTITTKGCVEITETISVREFSPGSSKKCGENITWEFAGGVLTLSGYGDMYDYYTAYSSGIPSDTNVPWYEGFKCVKKIVIGEGITSVGDYSFTQFTELEEVILPNSLVSIGDYAFGRTYIQNTINIPENVSYIGEYAFQKCMFKTIELNDNITELSKGIFDSCVFERIDIPETVTVIGDYAFNNCRSLENLDIPDSVTTIGKYAFAKCWSMDNIDISANVSTIDEYAYSGCRIEKFTILKCVDYWGKGVLSGCGSLKEVVIEDGVESIPVRAFEDCDNLTDVTIPESVAEIGAYAFYNCKNLSEITLSSGLCKLGVDAFNGCSSLEEIVLPASLDYLDTCMFINCGSLSKVTVLNPTMRFTKSVIFDTNVLENLTFVCIKNSTTELMCKKKGYSYEYMEAEELSAFAKGYTYTYDKTFKTEDLSIEVLSDVDEYGVLYSYGEQFDFDNSYESIDALSRYYRYTLPYNERDPFFLQDAGVYPISYYIYSGNMSPVIGCTNIVIEKCQPEFYYEEELVRIPWRGNTSYGKIYDNPLQGLGIFNWGIAEYTSSDENIVKVSVRGDYSSKGYGEAVITATTKDLKNFEVHTASFKVQTYPIGTFPLGDFTIYVTEDGSVRIKEYKGTDIAPVIPDKFYDLSIIDIQEQAFSNSTIESVIIPESITQIRNAAFAGCENLEKVVLPNTLENILSSTFLNCKNLKEITIPKSVTHIDDYALGYCYENGKYSKTELVISGYSNSAAEVYADKHDIEFICLDEPEEIPTESVSTSVDNNHDEKITVYFTNTLNWKSVYIAYLSDCEDYQAPGKLMEYAYTNQYGQDVYKYDIPACTTGMHFSAGFDCDKTFWIDDGITHNAGFDIDPNGDKIDCYQFFEWSYGTWTYDPESVVTGTQATTSVESESNVANSSVCTDPTEEIVTDVSEVITDPTETNTDSSETVTDPIRDDTSIVTDPAEVPVESSVSESEIVSTESTTTENMVSTEVTTANTTESNSSVSESSIFENSTITNTAPTTNIEVVEYLAGDVNQDGKVNIKDATLIQKHIAKLTQLDDVGSACADVTADKKINIKDATMIQKYVAKLIETFPAGKTIKIS